MNRRFYCAVSVASGVLLLGGGVAEAAATADEADRNINPTATGGLPTDIFTSTSRQNRLAASIGDLVERSNNRTPGQGQAEIQPTTESLSQNGMSGTEKSPGSQVTNNAGAGRAELLPNIGGGGGGAGGTDALLGLLGGIPGGSLLGKLTTDGPLSQLLGDGPLGSLLGGAKKAPANDGGQSGAATTNSPRTQDPAIGGHDAATDWRQADPFGDRPSGDRPLGDRRAGDRRAGERPFGATDTDVADPALNGVVANPTRRLPALNQPTAHQVDDPAATRGEAVQVGVLPIASNNGDGFEEVQPAAGGKPLAGGMFGTLGKLGRVQILGGDTVAGLPVVGELLGDGLSLNTLDNIPAISDVMSSIGTKDAGEALPALGSLPAVGNLSRMLLGEESTSRRTEAADVRRLVTPVDQAFAPQDAVEQPSLGRVLAQRAIDKAKVTPELQALFGPVAPGVQEPSGIMHQLPPAG